jgi:hypothetical protein
MRRSVTRPLLQAPRDGERRVQRAELRVVLFALRAAAGLADGAPHKLLEAAPERSPTFTEGEQRTDGTTM